MQDLTGKNTIPTREKILIIRFSSFGDVTQCLSVPSLLKQHFQGCQVHWVTREDMAILLDSHPAVDRVWLYQRKDKLKGLIRLARELRQQNFTRVYDAHNNLRSRVISWVLRFPFGLTGPQLLRRSIRRWKRFLLFNFRINLFEQPFSGQRDLIEPLKRWGVPGSLPPAPQIFIRNDETENIAALVPREFIALAPSAAFELKRWPLEYWQELIKENSGLHFVLLGGPQDQFMEEIAAVAKDRVTNLAGKTSLRESAAVIARSRALVSNDTGLLHVAEQMGHPAIALMGPAPFGFPSRETTKILQLDLPCRPCSKHGQGPCRNSHFHQCLRDIKPDQVSLELRDLIKA